MHPVITVPETPPAPVVITKQELPDPVPEPIPGPIVKDEPEQSTIR